jgi:hypothetical protein
MPTVIEITNLGGLPPFDVYTCDTGYTTCVYVTTIIPAQLPYQFQIPYPQEGMNPLGLRVVDNTGCIVQENLTI